MCDAAREEFAHPDADPIQDIGERFCQFIQEIMILNFANVVRRHSYMMAGKKQEGASLIFVLSTVANANIIMAMLAEIG